MAASRICRLGAENFTTVELKSNFFSTAREGTIATVARPVHMGDSTQVWDAVVSRKADGKQMALFRCTSSFSGRASDRRTIR